MMSYKNPMSFESNNIHSPKKLECYILKILTFYCKMPIEAPIFPGNKLYQDDPNDQLYPIV